MMDNAESLFVSGASFRGVSTCVRRLKLMSDAANDISAVVRSQYEEFSELSEVEFDGRYKVESDECFSISDYVDADGTFASFQEIINGNCSDVLKNTDSLSECRALLFRAPQLPNMVLIQRFTNSYLAKRDRWFGFGCSDSVRKIEESAFTIASSLSGVYDLESKRLRFKSVQNIRAVLPGFSDQYAPGADKTTITTFFRQPIFDQDSADKVQALDSMKVARLVWLLKEQDAPLERRLATFQKYDEILNLNSVRNGKIIVSTEVRKMEVILRILLGDVFEDNGRIYLSNSKRPIERFA